MNLNKRKAQSRRVSGTKSRPRVSIYRSNRHIYAQLVDDENGKTLVVVDDKVTSKNKELTKIKSAEVVGEKLAQKAKSKKIKKVVFDRGDYKYHGRVKAIADALRKGGLKF